MSLPCSSPGDTARHNTAAQQIVHQQQQSPQQQQQQQYRRGSLQLWQFLVALLHDPSNSSCIAWTGRGMEFKLVEPEEVKLNFLSDINN